MKKITIPNYVYKLKHKLIEGREFFSEKEIKNIPLQFIKSGKTYTITNFDLLNDKVEFEEEKKPEAIKKTQ